MKVEQISTVLRGVWHELPPGTADPWTPMATAVLGVLGPMLAQRMDVAELTDLIMESSAPLDILESEILAEWLIDNGIRRRVVGPPGSAHPGAPTP